MNEMWEKFARRIADLEDLSHAIKLMHWDQEVMMPPKGGPGRARSLATLQAISHDRLTDPEMGGLLDELSADDSLDEWQKASVRNTKREYDKATKVPEALVRELAELEATAYQVWTEARPADDFKMLQPHLERMLVLKKEAADAIGFENERYDALLDDFEPGMTAKEVEAMFGELGDRLRPLVDAIIDAAGEEPAFANRTYDPAEQVSFCSWLVGEMRYDLQGGRLDTSPHPFTMTVGSGDVRQTTKADPSDLLMSIFGVAHETGHALYEQNLPDEYKGTPAGQVPSLGLHESQSRLWENQVARGRSFASFYFPELKRRFPDQLSDTDLETFYRGISHPKRTLIRVTADEVTYNLHVALRFDVELALFRDELDVKDMPDAFNDAMERWLGIRPPNATDGVLQDMHWSIGALGYFPTYTLGTLYSAAFFDKAKHELPGLDDELAKGNVEPLLEWLKTNIYSQGYLYPAKVLAEKVLGEPISATPFVDYIRTKYGELYSTTF
ncbi:MAG: carboxypeptidase M32 [Actinomycetota bacterium]